MLKITIHTDGPNTILDLEGKLAGPWVEELKGCWREAAARSGRPVRVMLCAVTFIDDKGIDLLAEIYRHGGELIAEGCMNKAVAERIMQERRQDHE